jgi:integrase/recombinase XerD
MTVVYVKAFFHRKHEQIAFHFSESVPLNRVIRTVPHVKWSQTNRCWYIPFDKDNLKAAQAILHTHARLELDEFKTYLQKRCGVLATNVPRSKSAIVNHGLTKSGLSRLVISAENIGALKEMKKYLELKVYSQNTMALYMGEMVMLARLLGGRMINDLTANEIQSYLLWLIKKKQCSESKIHTTINALKLYCTRRNCFLKYQDQKNQ